MVALTPLPTPRRARPAPRRAAPLLLAALAMVALLPSSALAFLGRAALSRTTGTASSRLSVAARRGKCVGCGCAPGSVGRSIMLVGSGRVPLN